MLNRNEEWVTSFVEKAYEEDVDAPEDYWVETHNEKTVSPQKHHHKIGETLRPFICLLMVYFTFLLMFLYFLYFEKELIYHN